MTLGSPLPKIHGSGFPAGVRVFETLGLESSLHPKVGIAPLNRDKNILISPYPIPGRSASPTRGRTPHIVLGP